MRFQSPSLSSEACREDFDQSQHRRPCHHDEEHRQDAQHQRNRELRADLCSLFYSPLAPLIAQGLAVDADGIADDAAEPFSMRQRSDKLFNGGEIIATCQISQGFVARPPGAHFQDHQIHFVREQWMAH
jgi:hypothetical protein